MSDDRLWQARATPRTRISTAYSEPGRIRLCGSLNRFLTTALVAAALATLAGGCSYRLGGADKGSDTTERTATIPSTAKTVWAPIEADLAVARAAVVELFTRGAKDSSQAWENPRTGAHGTITPIATAYTQDGTLCRDFLASYLRDEKQSWFQGGACRKGSKWEVRDIRALDRS
jgi:hypothetical protein